ncbi:ribosomal RNA large subunit methyltransferase E [Agaricicola taiwanensis]|uniref:Ribosomal RNA large subunit methyltransferase E n=1 Tax=Agaricicola taiwanensis TaxID=591372 RepID=A0A8J2VU73_9RHOB|nr:RlmE family RNA methyltransferase [Agaricicola taiwanensis]GGE38010.1 ribosomal RNA large subunit methyltransferase E [Agaricicola taiwanensis]
MTKDKIGESRPLGVRLKTAKKRTTSSQKWLERQLNDPYVSRAKREGYRSRAAYKLLEIDEKHRILKSGQRVVDLGAAPGGWSQIAAARCQSVEGKGRVVGIDRLEMEPIPGVELFHLDFLDEDAPEKLKSALGGKADIVLSDMAANTTGHRQTDHLRTMGLVEAALAFAIEITAPGGVFLAKVLQGGTQNELLTLLKQHYRTVKHVKPSASRADSSELYVLALGFKGQEQVDQH